MTGKTRNKTGVIDGNNNDTARLISCQGEGGDAMRYTDRVGVCPWRKRDGRGGGK